MRKLIPLRVLLLAATLAGVEARAEDAVRTPLPEHIRTMSDDEVSRRLDFLVGRLDQGRDYAWWWWNGWTAFYGLGVAVEGVRAGLTDSDAKRAEYVIGAVKAAGGVTVLLLRPLQAKDGADAVREVAESPDGTPRASTPELRRQQLAVAETLLQENAEVSLRRYNWLRHVLNAAINGAGAIIIWKGFDDPSRAIRSGLIGTGVGEVSFWTQPWWPADDWDEYQHRFNPTSTSNVRWRFGPTAGGAALRIDF